MKILLINNFHYRKGGSETVYFNNAKLLRQAGHEVCFFSVRREENFETTYSQYFISDSSKMSKAKGLLKYFYNSEAATKLEQLILEEKPDIAHAHLMWGCMAPAIFKVLRKYNIPLVHTVHDYRMVCPAYTFTSGGKICEECKGKYFYKCAAKRCSKGSLLMSTVMAIEMFSRNVLFNPAKNISGLIYVSNFAKDIHERYSPSIKKVPSMVLYNCTEEPYKKENNKGDYFLYFGRLSYEKGVELLIDTFKELPDAKLKIVGTGPIEKELKQKAVGASQIEFLGFKSGDGLHQIIRNAKFVIVPSQWYENNPMTIIEAYSFGTPVIGSNLGGIPEIIQNGTTGFVFEHNRKDSLMETLSSAMNIGNEAYHQMIINAFKYYEAHFSENGYAGKLVDFYKKILNK